MFRRRYGLPPTDPRYLEATPEQIITDHWANHYEERRLAGKEDEEDEDEDFDEDRIRELMAAHPTDWLKHVDDLEDLEEL